MQTRCRHLLLVCTASTVIADTLGACDANAHSHMVQQAVGGDAANAEELTSSGCPADQDEESCICAAFRLGWEDAAKSILRARMLRKQAAPNVRRYAQALHDGSTGVLARLHTRYPQHLKLVPAIEWAQTMEHVLVRIRFARYTRGEALAYGAERLEMRYSDDALHVVAEGDDKPLFIETSLKWRHPLRRTDSCSDTEPGCAKWAAEGACAMDATYETPSLSKRCAKSCGACSGVNGSLAVVSTWAAVPGGILFEARKASDEMWERLLTAPNPTNRIAGFGEAPEVGALLECASSCRQAAGCPYDAGLLSWATGVKEGAEAEKCAESCRRQCATQLAQRYRVS